MTEESVNFKTDQQKLSNWTEMQKFSQDEENLSGLQDSIRCLTCWSQEFVEERKVRINIKNCLKN